MVLALVGFIGLTNSLAATSRANIPTCCAPGYTEFIGAPGSCPTMAAHGAALPGVIGLYGF